MALTKEELVMKRSAQRASATRLMTSSVVDGRGDIGEEDIDVFDTFCRKISDNRWPNFRQIGRKSCYGGNKYRSLQSG